MNRYKDKGDKHCSSSYSVPSYLDHWCASSPSLSLSPLLFVGAQQHGVECGRDRREQGLGDLCHVSEGFEGLVVGTHVT